MRAPLLFAAAAAAPALALALASAPAVAAPKPHLILMLVDDYGWNNVGFHARDQPNAQEIVTPHMDDLAANGVILDRHYVFRFCSPSRSSFQTGRNPIHVNTGNDYLTLVNKQDPVAGFAGIPRNMTVLAEKLAAAGYATAQAGKWHCGLATPTHTPMGRGYQQSLTYLDGANDYWTLQTTGFCDPKAYQDLWEHDRPATEMANPLTCSQANQMPNCIYEDDRVANFTLNVINAHDPATPFHMYIAWHNTHEPLEVPQKQLDKFDFVFSNCTAMGGSPNKNNSCSAAFLAATEDGPLGDLADKPCCFRQYYSAMTNYVDMHIGQVVDALKAKGMWENTFMVVSSDNGGPIYRNGSAGGNNFPLRGGKKSNFEGGVRVNAFVTGGLVPEARRGQVEAGFAASEDWFRTLAGLAGVDPEDPKAAAAGLPPVEGYDLWPLLSGANATSPRTELWLGSGGAGDSDSSQSPILQGLIRADGYKVLWGNVIENTWTGAFYPNRSTAWCDTCPLDCGTIDAPTCLFNVLTDPTEHENVAAAKPGIVQAMSARLVELSQGIFKPDRGLPDNTDACYAGDKTYNGWVGPFLP